MRQSTYQILKQVSLLAFAVVTALSAPLSAAAAAQNITPAAQVSFTFDDALESTLTKAAPTLQKYGMAGTAYITTNCVGSVGTCNADTEADYLNWSQVAQLQNTYGWEIGAHTSNHYPMTTLTDAEKDFELSESKRVLGENGYDAVSFATPQGDYDNSVLRLAAKYYESHRGFWDQRDNVWPNNEYLVSVKQVQVGVSVANVRAAIDAAIANKQWIVLVFHDIKDDASTGTYDYQYATADLDAIAAYVKSRQDAGAIKPVLVRNAFASSDVNLLPNSSFNSGLSEGWRTDSPANISVDRAGNGNFPDPAASVRFVSGTRNAHLFSPGVAVESDVTYLLKNYVDVTRRTGGELGFYIDEYDAAGNWISGQWKGAETSVFVQNYNFTYKPTSAAVKTASLQVYVTGNSGITAYLDNAKWFPLIEATAPPVTPPVEPPVTPPADPANMVENGQFDAGISAGWTTDSGALVTADATGNGAAGGPTNSVKFSPNVRNSHLFSPKVGVTAGKTYDLTGFVRMTQRTGGELGFYIDEYDAAGNWISGQWKAERSALGSGDTSIAYTPSSGLVASASLQVYVTGNSGITAYLDAIRWFAR